MRWSRDWLSGNRTVQQMVLFPYLPPQETPPSEASACMAPTLLAPWLGAWTSSP